MAGDYSQLHNVADQTFLCLFSNKKNLGACCLDAERGVLQCVEDVEECSDRKSLVKKSNRHLRCFDCPAKVPLVLWHTQPIVVLFHQGCAETVLDLMEELQATPREYDRYCPDASAVKLPSNDFDYIQCKSIITKCFASLNKTGQDGKVTSLLSFNFDAVCMIRAVGALLKYCNVNGVMGERDNSLARTIYAVRLLELRNMVIVDQDAYRALQIFKLDLHPSVYKAGRDGCKEGFSLFSIMNNCVSSVGAKELRRIFRQPSRDVRLLNDRLDAVQFLANDGNVHLVEAMRKPLRRVCSLGKTFCNLRVSTMTPAAWIRLYDTLERCLYLVDLLTINRTNLPTLIAEMCQNNTEDLRWLLNETNRTINFVSTRREKRLVVRSDVDDALRERHLQYENLPEILTSAAREAIDQLPFEVDECSIVYAPMIGYLLSLTFSHRDVAYGNYPNVQFLFEMDGRLYFKTPFVEQLNRSLGDLKMDIVDRELCILQNLQAQLLQRAPAILELVNQAARLDSFISLSISAREFNWSRPTISAESMLNIVGARHPLVELKTSPFVNNPIRSGAEDNYGLLHILTGPNAAGKSVYLKQVGLVVFLAHVGSFVPAVKAELGVVDKILCRIHNVGSVLFNLSTFAYDLKQMCVAINNATERSLILIDEFGKGTPADVGLSLLASCLQYWLEREEKCPHIFVSTHLHALLTLLPQSPYLKAMTMKVVRRNDELVYFYSIIDGVALHSYAANAALKAGLPLDLVQRIHKIFQMTKRCQPLQPSNMSVEQWNNKYRKSLSLVNTFLQFPLNKGNVPALLDLIRSKASLNNN